MEGRGFRDHSEGFLVRNAVIVGVSFDTVEENAAFANKFDFPYPLLCDTDRTLGVAYGAAEGPDAGHAKRISYWIGPDGTVRRAYAAVDPESHPGQVLKDLD